MPDLQWPAELAPYRMGFYLQPHVGGTESPLSRQRKTYLLSAPRWVCSLTFRGGQDGLRNDHPRSWARRLDALIVKMEGGANRVALWDFRRERRLSPYGGALVSSAAAKGATTATVAGFSPHAPAFYAGEYIGGDGRPHIVLDDVEADAAGVATITFKPPLAAALGSGAMVFERASGWFRLTSEDAGQNLSEVGQATEFTLDFVEDLTGGA